MTSTRRKRTATVAITAALSLLLGPALASTTPAQAAPGAGDRTATYQAVPGTIGAVPDAGDALASPCVSAAPGVREVSINVSGLTTPLTDVRVRLAAEHDRLGDLSVYLVAPDGTTTPVLDRVGRTADAPCGDGTGVNGSLAFYDGAPGDLTASAAAAGDTGDITTGSYGAQAAGGAASSLTAPFVGHTLNGTWRLRIVDSAPGVAGRVYAAGLTLSTVAKNATVECAAATAAATAATAVQASARATLQKAKKKLTKAKKKDKPQKVVRKKKKKLRKAQKASGNAVAATVAARKARTSACT